MCIFSVYTTLYKCFGKDQHYKQGVFFKDVMDFLSLEKGITLVYGVPASGKTTFCLQLAYDFTLHHKKVLMVSCEPLYLERFEQLAGTHFKECLSYFLALRVQTFQEQVQKVLELEHLKNISLILIDGFTTFYRK